LTQRAVALSNIPSDKSWRQKKIATARLDMELKKQIRKKKNTVGQIVTTSASNREVKKKKKLRSQEAC